MKVQNFSNGEIHKTGDGQYFFVAEGLRSENRRSIEDLILNVNMPKKSFTETLVKKSKKKK